MHQGIAEAAERRDRPNAMQAGDDPLCLCRPTRMGQRASAAFRALVRRRSRHITGKPPVNRAGETGVGIAIDPTRTIVISLAIDLTGTVVILLAVEPPRTNISRTFLVVASVSVWTGALVIKLRVLVARTRVIKVQRVDWRRGAIARVHVGGTRRCRQDRISVETGAASRNRCVAIAVTTTPLRLGIWGCGGKSDKRQRGKGSKFLHHRLQTDVGSAIVCP
jgi:hypothetical protein